MTTIIKQIKEFSNIYIYLIIFGTAAFNFFMDCKSLKKKKLYRDEKISKAIGYIYITLGIGLFIVVKFV